MTNTLMTTFSESEMLTLWKQILHLEVPRTDCSVQRTDGINLDALITTHIRQWYAHLLTTAPAHLLPVENIASLVTLTSRQGVVEITLPTHCVRPLEVKLNGWKQSVTEFLVPHHPKAKMQSSPLMRSGCENPTAVLSGNKLTLYSIAPDKVAMLETLRAVVKPTEGTYTFGQEALATIPRFAESL